MRTQYVASEKFNPRCAPWGPWDPGELLPLRVPISFLRIRDDGNMGSRVAMGRVWQSKGCGEGEGQPDGGGRVGTPAPP